MKWMLAMCLVLAVLHHRGHVVDGQIGGIRSKIQLVNNGYNLLIAIDERVKEDSVLITKIEEYFTEASGLLFIATKYRAMLRNIIVLVPTTWTEGSYDEADTETFNGANVRITNSKRHIPYVVQPSDCGVPGDCMYLTDFYLLGNGTLDIQVKFPPAKTILHELGHLLYGTFDEGPLSGDIPPFYHGSDGKIQPSACGKNIQGNSGTLGVDTANQAFRLEPGCLIDPATSLPRAECTFWPNVTHPNVTASIMDSRSIFVQDMAHFCDDDVTSPQTLHNADSPSKHNTRCKKRSTMAVILDRPDFANGANQPVSPSTETTPRFKVLRQKNQQVVLVLDTSGSMDDKLEGSEVSKMAQLRQAASVYIDDLPLGTQVAMVKFANNAHLLHGLVKITSDEDRDSLKGKLPPKSDDQNTCIGCGLLEAMEILQTNGSTGGAQILLITDGMQSPHYSPDIDAVLPKLQEAGLIGDAILFTTMAGLEPVRFTEKLGGTVFLESGAADSTTLQGALLATTSKRQSPSSPDATVQLALQAVTVMPGEDQVLTVFVDSSVGRRTRFTFSYRAAKLALTILASSPSDQTFTAPQGPHAVHNTEFRTVRIEIPNAESGEWTIRLRTGDTEPQHLQLLVTSLSASPDTAAITTSSTITQQYVDFKTSKATDQPLAIQAQVTQGFLPVVKATVTAYVRYGDYELKVPLLDTGSGADSTKLDGIYSGYYVLYNGDGLYTVEVKVTNEDKTAAVLDTSILPFVVPDSASDSDGEFSHAGDFVRSVTAGFFSVTNQVGKNIDVFPPSRVTDLSVIGINHKKQSVHLQWTEVGDDLDQGTASAFEIRRCLNQKQLTDQFNTCTLAERHDQPLPAGSTENIDVHMASAPHSTVVFLALRVEDDDGKLSDVSNVVSVVFEAPDKRGLNIALIAGAAGGFLVLVVVVIVCGLCVKRHGGPNQVYENAVNLRKRLSMKRGKPANPGEGTASRTPRYQRRPAQQPAEDAVYHMPDDSDPTYVNTQQATEGAAAEGLYENVPADQPVEYQNWPPQPTPDSPEPAQQDGTEESNVAVTPSGTRADWVKVMV